MFRILKLDSRSASGRRPVTRLLVIGLAPRARVCRLTTSCCGVAIHGLPLPVVADILRLEGHVRAAWPQEARGLTALARVVTGLLQGRLGTRA